MIIDAFYISLLVVLQIKFRDCKTIDDSNIYSSTKIVKIWLFKDQSKHLVNMYNMNNIL